MRAGDTPLILMIIRIMHGTDNYATNNNHIGNTCNPCHI